MPHQKPDVVRVTVDTPGVADIPPNPLVGKIYEVAINGRGLMLDDNPEIPDSMPTNVMPSLDAPRLATTDTPFDQAIERYSFATFHDWEAGRGQRWLNREEATYRAYRESEGVDPFSNKGELSLLPAMEQILDNSTPYLRVVTVGDELYAQVGEKELSRFDGEDWDEPIELSHEITDLASDGQYWYATTGQLVYRGTAVEPDNYWSDASAARITWSGGRICAAGPTGTSVTPNSFFTLGHNGTIEATHLTLDEGHTIVLGGTAQGVFYFGSYVGDRGAIWAWQLGLDDEGNFHVPNVAFDMPQGLIPTRVAAVAGEVWVRAVRVEGPDAGQVLIYRLVPGQGGATPVVVADLGRTYREGDFAEIGDMVLFSWANVANDEASLGAVYLPTGGHARWTSPHVDGPIRNVVECEGVEVVAVVGHGVYKRSLTASEEEGWVTSSVVDGGSTIEKVLDTLTLETQTLQLEQSVDLALSLDGGLTFQPILTLDTAGARRKVARVSQRTPSWAVRTTLKGPGKGNPTTVLSVQGKYHPLGLRDRIIQVRIKCYDTMTGVNGAPLPDNKPHYGAQTLRWLEGLSQSRVLFQDVDWHITQRAVDAEVVHVNVVRTLMYDRQLGVNRIGGTADVTLRVPCGTS